MADVNASDEIWVAEGTYKPDQGVGKTAEDRTIPFLLVNGVGMYGGFKGTETARTPLGDGNHTILSGEINDDSTLWSLNVVSGVDLDGNTTMDGFHITKGNANGPGVLANGGGLYLSNSFPTLTNCVLTDNSAFSGGGMYNSSSSPTLINCTFTGNSATDKSSKSGGGGMYNSSSSPTLINCTFTGNSFTATGSVSRDQIQSGGGGIYNYSSSPTLTNCRFTGNSFTGIGVYSGGGGMYNLGVSPTLTNCTFTGNLATGTSEGLGGGGMYSSSSFPILANCRFTGNSAFSGGGMYVRGGSPTLTNCAFSGNSASYGGGGMYNAYFSSPTLTDCLFTGNSVTDAHPSRGGGGMRNSSSSPTLTNCVFSGISAKRDGGGMINGGGSPTLTNCIFSGNSAHNDGGGIDNHSTSTLTNCVFSGNSASNGGGISNGSGSPTLTNCVLWGNLTGSNVGHGIYGDSWKGIVLQEAVAPQFPGDPNAKDAVYLTSNILQGWDGDTRAFSSDPMFVNIEDPDGPDDKWFTADDGLRLKAGSLAIDAGYNASLPADNGDVDGDGDKTEAVPLDLAGYVRIQNGKVDLGPYEYGDSRIPTFVVSLTSIPSNAGSLTGDDVSVQEGNSTTISTTTNAGYLFTGWSGDASGTTNPLTITVDAAKTITANFAQDLNDTDGDGLSNYAELVIHGTDKTKADTDGDGLSDKVEIDGGMNARVSDKATIDVIKSNATAFGLAPIEEMTATGATPHTNGWYYQPDWGWLWTKAKTFPYVYRDSTGGKQPGWLYFREGSAPPYFHNYATGTWSKLGE